MEKDLILLNTYLQQKTEEKKLKKKKRKKTKYFFKIIFIENFLEFFSWSKMH